MIKVLHVSDKLSVGNATLHGVTRLFSWWIPGFDRSRYCVSACSLRGRDRAGAYLEELGIKIFYLGRHRFDPMTVFDLWQLIRQNKIDILHLHGYGAWTFGRIAGIAAGIPVILHEHMVDPNIPAFQRFADRVLAGSTTQAIAVSEAVKEFMIRYRSVPEDRLEIIQNGIPLEKYQIWSGVNGASPSANQWRLRLGVPATHKVVGTIGRLSAVKGHSDFLKAAQLVLQKYREITFLVVGDGELRTDLEDLTHELDIADSVRFTGYCADVAGILSTMDVMVIPSLSEGGPLTLFEAMATGCAVISTDAIGLKHAVQPDVTGFLVPVREPAAIAERIELLMRDSDRLAKMKAAAREKVAEYDVLHTIDKLEHCYQTVIQQKS